MFYLFSDIFPRNEGGGKTSNFPNFLRKKKKLGSRIDEGVDLAQSILRGKKGIFWLTLMSTEFVQFHDRRLFLNSGISRTSIHGNFH